MATQFGEIILEELEARNMSIADLALLIDGHSLTNHFIICSLIYIKTEKLIVDEDFLEKLANALDVPPEFIKNLYYTDKIL